VRFYPVAVLQSALLFTKSTKLLNNYLSIRILQRNEWNLKLKFRYWPP
jgi:hypothetical protein